MLPSTRRAAKHSLAIPPPCTGAPKSAPAAVMAAKTGRKRCVEALPCLPCGRNQCHRQAGRRCLPTGTDPCHGQSPVAPPGSGGCAPPCAEQPEGHAKVLIFYFARRIFSILTLPVGRKPAHRGRPIPCKTTRHRVQTVGKQVTHPFAHHGVLDGARPFKGNKKASQKKAVWHALHGNDATAGPLPTAGKDLLQEQRRLSRHLANRAVASLRPGRRCASWAKGCCTASLHLRHGMCNRSMPVPALQALRVPSGIR